MKAWILGSLATAALLTLGSGVAAAAGAAKDYRLASLSADGGRMHGSVCRTAVQVQRQAPDVVLRGLDEQGRVVSQRDVALYGRTNDRVGGCAYFNALVQVVDGARAEICLMDGEQARQCVAAPPG